MIMNEPICHIKLYSRSLSNMTAELPTPQFGSEQNEVQHFRKLQFSTYVEGNQKRFTLIHEITYARTISVMNNHPSRT